MTSYGTPATYVATTSSGSRTATFVVNLPADARLIVNGSTTRSTTARRVFVSPPLEPGGTYYYTLRAEITRGGETLATTRQVSVRPGQQTEVTLDIPIVTTTASR